MRKETDFRGIIMQDSVSLTPIDSPGKTENTYRCSRISHFPYPGLNLLLGQRPVSLAFSASIRSD